ncbi:hypothetical protein DPSP01_014515 [Paraphaeosphaeria sporulosa]
MALIRLLQRKPDGGIVFRETTNSDVPAYAILSHTWGEEEVIFQDMKGSADMSKAASKAGWKKIQFCARQAAADGLQYFWIDTCCIDKTNAVELSAVINSMFRWYQDAARCYVYLPDVSKADNMDDESAWKEALRKSRWFTRGWTLQELIAPKLVDFFSSEGTEHTGGWRKRFTSCIRVSIPNNMPLGLTSHRSLKPHNLRHKEKHTAIFWLNANNEDSLQLSFRSIAQQVLQSHPSNKVLGSVDLEGDLNRVVVATKAWLNLHGNARWLLIYDNYDNPRISNKSNHSTVDIRQYLLESDQGSIIITTRSARVTQGRRLHVQKLTGLEDGLKILANTSGREGITNDSGARELVSKLDGLPLALATAGAYLEHVTDSFAEYLRLYEESWVDLQATSPTLSSYEDRSLYTTWQVTFDLIRKQNAASAQLLKLWAYFDKQDMWFELIRHARSTDDEWIQKLTQNKVSFNKAVRLLCEYGLAHPEPSLGQPSGSGGYGVHSCVHSWTISVLNGGWDDGLARLALTCVASEVPNTDVDKWWLLQQRLLQHVARHRWFIMNSNMDFGGMEWTLHKLGMLYADQGKLAEAEAMYSRALQGYEEALGPKHTSTLSTVNNLGNLYKNQGKLAEAEAMYSRALQGKEEALGRSSR